MLDHLNTGMGLSLLIVFFLPGIVMSSLIHLISSILAICLQQVYFPILIWIPFSSFIGTLLPWQHISDVTLCWCRCVQVGLGRRGKWFESKDPSDLADHLTSHRFESFVPGVQPALTLLLQFVNFFEILCATRGCMQTGSFVQCVFVVLVYCTATSHPTPFPINWNKNDC